MGISNSNVCVYFHKAVILVLDHSNTFTKGIIINRPSGRTVEDEVNEGLTWRVWYGGDVQGLDSLAPDIICLHSLRSEEAREASVAIMKDVQVRRAWWCMVLGGWPTWLAI